MRISLNNSITTALSFQLETVGKAGLSFYILVQQKLADVKTSRNLTRFQQEYGRKRAD